MSEVQISTLDEQVANNILTQDIIKDGRTVDQYGIMGWARDHFRKLLREYGNLKYDDAIELAVQDMKDIPVKDSAFARDCLLEMMKTGKTLENMGLERDCENIMKRVIANIHGHNEGTTISA